MELWMPFEIASQKSTTFKKNYKHWILQQQVFSQMPLVVFEQITLFKTLHLL
jgi:hypothetical protein